jgi:deazaflavin-dependent oxidoreductase (nitroreductase family)
MSARCFSYACLLHTGPPRARSESTDLREPVDRSMQVGEPSRVNPSGAAARGDDTRAGRVLRRFLRSPFAKAPTALYESRLGWLLGHRFLLLVHRGRRTHIPHRTVLEVVAWRPADREAVVVSGLGPGAQWYKNTLAGDAIEIQIDRDRFVPSVRQLHTEEAVRTIADYERRNRIIAPLVRAGFSALGGFRFDGSDAARRRLVETLPVVAFRPSDHAIPNR